MNRRLSLPLLLCLLLALSVPANAADDLAPVKGRGAAKEGDLVTVKGQEFRLYGIDAPDEGQKCLNVRGREYDCFRLSTEIMRRLINNRDIECTPKGAPVGAGPRHGVCRAENGDDLALAMVERGYALAYRPLTFDYSAVEALASSYRRGLWAGRVEAPWLWRSRQAEEKLNAMRKGGAPQ